MNRYITYSDEVKKAYLLCEVLREMPLFISDNAVFVGTQRDAFAKSYALINPSFTVIIAILLNFIHISN